MATDAESLSFRNSDDDDTFWKKESSNVQEENSTQETQSLNVESSSCFLSEEEIEHCLDSPQIKYNFTDINNIGAGGFGSVYEAVHIIENRKYALKFVKISYLDVDKREVKTLASLDHPNVLKYYNSWMTPFHGLISCSKESGIENSGSIVSFQKDTTPSENDIAIVSPEPKSKNGKSSEADYDAYLVIQTELCIPNKNLKTLIDEGELFTMSDENRLNLFLDIVSGLQYIHKKGIMHRDLKPPNILIDKDNRAKIGDFGLARKCKISPADETPDNDFTQNVGTYLYVAPEVRNSTVYDKKADMYSLGMILFEMYHKMGSSMERIKTMEKLRNQEFSDLQNIPAQFGNIRLLVKSLLSHEPSLRKTLKTIIQLLSPLEKQQSVKMNRVQSKPRIVRKIKIRDEYYESSDSPTVGRSNKFLLSKYSRLQRTMKMRESTHKCRHEFLLSEYSRLQRAIKMIELTHECCDEVLSKPRNVRKMKIRDEYYESSDRPTFGDSIKFLLSEYSRLQRTMEMIESTHECCDEVGNQREISQEMAYIQRMKRHLSFGGIQICPTCRWYLTGRDH